MNFVSLIVIMGKKQLNTASNLNPGILSVGDNR